ncbi:MAG: BatA domain-containing protein, partial [Candidatus Coproplasma sp.]
MSFIYPLGLLGLIAVPVLIIIYIIKNKYTEQVISATYLWTLSEKFLKRKNPINRLTGIISLILQILAVVFISFAIAQPVFTVPGGAYDYCFILDGSGSMNMVQTDRTRLEI